MRQHPIGLISLISAQQIETNGHLLTSADRGNALYWVVAGVWELPVLRRSFDHGRAFFGDTCSFNKEKHFWGG